MKKNDVELSNKLYLRLSLIIFIFLLAILMLIATFVLLILFSPIFKFVKLSLPTATMVVLTSIYIVSAFISTIFVYLISRKVLRPIVDLTDKINKVAKGDYTVSVKEKSIITPLQECLKHFNLLVKELNKTEMISKDFISNVSHEFQTPLAVITSNVTILSDNSLSEEERNNSLKLIDESAKRLSSLVNNILKISKLDNQNVTFDVQEFRLDEQLRNNILFFQDNLESKNIELDIDIDDCMISSSYDLLEHVWTNLISNAIKYSYQNGLIEIKLKKDKDVIVSIKDNGIGIKQEDITHIFDKFYQVDGSHNNEGNGLGLSIVQKIIKLLNLKIDVNSELGKGTEFIVTIPKEKIKEL